MVRSDSCLMVRTVWIEDRWPCYRQSTQFLVQVTLTTLFKLITLAI